MRELTEHKVNPVNDVIKVVVADEPNASHASHRYEVSGFNTASNPSRMDYYGFESSFSKQVLIFQNGPIDAGVNGITHEVLLAIVADRLRNFQSGPYACRENALALTKLEEATHWLNHRTLARMQRGVEGTHNV